MKETRMEITHRIRLGKACGMCSKSCPAQITIHEALEIYKEYLAGDLETRCSGQRGLKMKKIWAFL